MQAIDETVLKRGGAADESHHDPNSPIRIVLLAAPLGAAATAQANDTTAAEAKSNDEIIIYGRVIQQIGIASSGSQGTVGYYDFELRPILRTGELLEIIPA